MIGKTIHFADQGQDFLEWDLDRNGVVVDSRPFQATIWCGTKVLNRQIAPGAYVRAKVITGRELELKYPVVSIAPKTIDETYTCYVVRRTTSGDRGNGTCWKKHLYVSATLSGKLNGNPLLKWTTRKDDAKRFFSKAGAEKAKPAKTDEVIHISKL
jgi:hypothetical protein